MQQGLLVGEHFPGCRNTSGKPRRGSCDTPLDVGSCLGKTHSTGISRLLGNLIVVGNNKAVALDGDLLETLAQAQGCLFLLPAKDNIRDLRIKWRGSIITPHWHEACPHGGSSKVAS